MNPAFRIDPVETIDNPIWMVIGGGISAYNAQQAGDDSAQHVCFVLRGPDDETAGGVIAEVYWDWLYINLMWNPRRTARPGVWVAAAGSGRGRGPAPRRDPRLSGYLQLSGAGVLQQIWL